MRAASLALVALLALSGCISQAAGPTSASTSAATTTARTTTNPAPTAMATTATPPAPAANATQPAAMATPTMAGNITKVTHVFVMVLENEGYNTTFASPPPSPYLALNLTRMGRLLTNYYGTGHASLDNYVAMVSGQSANALTQADCALYADFVGPTTDGSGQAVGEGCVYPTAIANIGSQLTAAHHTWRAYAQSMADLPSVPQTCRHQPVNSQDTWQGETAGDPYATRHVPLLYFHNVIDDQAHCDAHVVDLKELPKDLANASATPEYVFVTPDVCADGHDATCAANTSRPGGYAGIEQFLRLWVPRILNSTAFRQGGLLVVNFDEAATSDTTACCGQTPGPGSPKPGITGPGGGRVGAILLSPCIQPGSVDPTPYNHFSLLRTTEDVFGVSHLAAAAQVGLVPLDLGRCTPKDS